MLRRARRNVGPIYRRVGTPSGILTRATVPGTGARPRLAGYPGTRTRIP